jgi:hypothetical protein
VGDGVARDLGFIDPEDALNPRHVDLDAIESREDAERVLKRVAKQRSHLIKAEEPERPQIGQVLSNGQAPKGQACRCRMTSTIRLPPADGRGHAEDPQGR